MESWNGSRQRGGRRPARKGRGRVGRGQMGVGTMAHPMVVAPLAATVQYDATIVVPVHLRFVCNATASLQSISAAQLLNSMISSTAANTVGCTLFDGVKVNKLRLFDPSGNTIGIQWLGSATQARQSVIEATGGTGIPSCIITKPPRKALAQDWMTSTAPNQFALTFHTGTVLDLWMTCLIGGNTSGQLTNTTTTMVAGVVYYNSLDGTTNNIQSAGYPAIH